ncbi:unnamed protein product [Ectocarpus fasciculatus]
MGSVGGGFGSAGRPATGQTPPSSGSYSALSSLSPDRREVGQGPSRDVYPSSASSIPGGGSAATNRFGRGRGRGSDTHGEMMEIAQQRVGLRRNGRQRRARLRQQRTKLLGSTIYR